MTPADYRYATNSQGKLGPDEIRRINSFLEAPSHDGWEDIHMLVINHDRGDGTYINLFEAVDKVDPLSKQCPMQSAEFRVDTGEMLRPWNRIPSPDIVRQAIAYATH